MGISEKKMQIVINNYFKQECSVDTSIREAFEKGFRIGVKKVSPAQQDCIPYKKPEIIDGKDLVSVVRCKDCKHHGFDTEYENYWCNLTSGVREVDSDDFCSYGERRGEHEQT